MWRYKKRIILRLNSHLAASLQCCCCCCYIHCLQMRELRPETAGRAVVAHSVSVLRRMTGLTVIHRMLRPGDWCQLLLWSLRRQRPVGCRRLGCRDKLSKHGRFGIECHPYTESCIDQFLCVCVYDYSSQTTGPICIKITLVDRTYDGDCYRLVRFELFTTSPLKFIQKA